MVTPTSLNVVNNFSFFLNSISPGSTSSLPRVSSDDRIYTQVQEGQSPAIAGWEQSGVYVNYEEIAKDSQQLAEFLNELLDDRQSSVEAALSNFREVTYDTQATIIIQDTDTVTIDFLIKILEKFPNASTIEIQDSDPTVIDVLALLRAIANIEVLRLSNLSQDVREHFQGCDAIRSNPKVQIDVWPEDIFVMD